VTLFHKPSNEASIRVLTLLKQANAQSVAHATEDQASSHKVQDKAEKTEFELDVTEAPPTSDQLKNILEYLGGSAGNVVQGASDESDALRRLKADGDAFQRPMVSPSTSPEFVLLILVGR
jgi:arsenate reductase-like glutaredoxin family protein